MILAVRRTEFRASIARALLDDSADLHWPQALARALGTKSGAVCPVLAQMVELGWLVAQREDPDAAGNALPRTFYRVADHGRASLATFAAGDVLPAERLCRGPGCSKALATSAPTARYCSNACGERYRQHAKRASEGRPMRPRMNTLRCRVEGCDRPARMQFMCTRHGQNAKYHGNPVPQRDRCLEDRLREVGWTVTATGCWEWNGKRNEHGYGIFNAKRLGLRDARAHRLVYQRLFGHALNDEQLLRHHCDNPPCVNPEHLEPGTHADNMADMVRRGRGRRVRRD